MWTRRRVGGCCTHVPCPRPRWPHRGNDCVRPKCSRYQFSIGLSRLRSSTSPGSGRSRVARLPAALRYRPGFTLRHGWRPGGERWRPDERTARGDGLLAAEHLRLPPAGFAGATCAPSAMPRPPHPDQGAPLSHPPISLQGPRVVGLNRVAPMLLLAPRVADGAGRSVVRGVSGDARACCSYPVAGVERTFAHGTG